MRRLRGVGCRVDIGLSVHEPRPGPFFPAARPALCTPDDAGHPPHRAVRRARHRRFAVVNIFAGRVAGSNGTANWVKGFILWVEPSSAIELSCRQPLAWQK